jgi:cytochrome P450
MVERVAALSSELFGVFAQPLPLRRYRAIDEALRALRLIVDELLDRQSDQPRTELTIELLRLRTEGLLTAEELISFCTMLLSVGQDTTQNLLGNSLHALLCHPEQRQYLQDNVAFLPRAWRELARFNTPVQLILRTASRDAMIGGQPVRAGERLHLFLGAANRDPAAFGNPDRLDFRRPEVTALPFGAGAHFCLGAHLAQLQLESALSVILPHLARFELLELRPQWFRSTHMRGLKSLRIGIRPD